MLRKTSVKDMSGLGIGFQLYFRLLDRLFILFIALTVLSVPSFLANYSGTSMSAVDVDSLSFALFTLGNQGSQCDSDSTSVFGNCEDLPCNDGTRRCLAGFIWTVDEIATLIGCLEVTIALLLGWFVEWHLVKEIQYFKKAREQVRYKSRLASRR